MGKIIVAVLVGAIVLGIIFWKFSPFSAITTSGPITLTMWGVWDDDAFIKSAIDSYHMANPNITINYTHQSLANYRIRAQTQVQAGQGPDIFPIHNTWTPMFLQNSYLYPMPDSVMSTSDYEKTFYPIAKDSFERNGKVYAMPLEVDGLALFYNEDILQAAGVNPPQYWSDLISSALKMTVSDTSGNIQTAGVALGTTTNVDYWSDILGLLFAQQPGVTPDNPGNQLGADVLTFYTSFIIDPRRKTWDVTLPSSTQMFESGKLAYYFAPSSKANEIKVANPNLNFKVIAVPQLPNHTPVAWGSFWGLAVSSNSQYPKESWDFLKYLTTQKEEQVLYAQEIKGKVIGLPYSRADLQQELLSDPFAGAFVAQGPYYKSWYLASGTQDAGLNDEMISNYQGAVNSVLQQNTNPQAALSGIAQQIQGTLDKYTKPPAAPSPK